MNILSGYSIINEGKKDEAIKLVSEMVDEVRRIKGIKQYDAYTSKQYENRIYWHSIFETDEAFKKHAEVMGRFGERMKQLFDVTKNEMSSCELIK
ncbi:MAG: antibiotic biosynthesis monooxygenase [Candidatus Heimdallarchaeota archaeon]|nr:antibiotic biosynthesis monooxygenase [Candidatus Heimdallarchaeota archaeon]